MGRVEKNNSPDAPRSAGQSNWHSLSSRSCVTCHRRKVRCDRKVPCTNCSKGDWTCVYPSKGRDSSRKPPSLQDVTDRLERVEAMLLRYCDDQGASRRLAEHEGQGTFVAQDSIQSSTENPPQNFGQRSRPWELLLNDGQRVQYVNNSNLKDLLQDVSDYQLTRMPLMSLGG